MKVKSEFKNLSPEAIWDFAVNYINENNSFSSVTGRVTYKSSVKNTDSSIYFIGGDGKRGKNGEIIEKYRFIHAYEQVKHLEVINTTSVKPYIDRQQTPFVGLLKSAGIIE